MRKNLKVIDKIKLCVYLFTGHGDFKGTKSLYCEKCGFESFTDIKPQTQVDNKIHAIYECNRCKSIVICSEEWRID